MSKTSKRKSEGRKRSCSAGSREKRLSVFDRLGTKAFPAGEPSLCRHNLQHGSCAHCNIAKFVAQQSLLNTLKRSTKKESDLRQEEEGSVRREGGEVDWSWDQEELEYEDEKALERRRQLLQRELQLQMKNDIRKHNNNNKKRSSSSSSSSSTVSSGSTTSSMSSENQPLSDLKKLIIPDTDLTSIKKTITTKMVYKDSSPSRRNSLSKKVSPARKVYKKKSVSPSQASTSRKSSPGKQRTSSSRKREGEVVRGRSKHRSSSRERRRERSKESRHRPRSPRPPLRFSTYMLTSQSSGRSSERKKDEDRAKREESRRERKPDVRDSRREHHEEGRSREKAREKERMETVERCRERQRDRDRREKSRTTQRSSTRDKERYSSRSQESKHCHQISPPPPPSHHPYRGERSRYGSSERERVSMYKDLSPRESDSRMRLSQTSSYSDSNRMRRRGWEGGRYDSPKSSREWEAQTSSERSSRDWDRVVLNEWHSRSQRDSLLQEERRSKHSQDKDYSNSGKEKDIDWKGSRVRESDEGSVSSSKRPRLEEPAPPPPICEPELSDISDDPDDILNRDDVEENMSEDARGDEKTEAVKDEENQAATTSALEHSGVCRLLDQRMEEDEAMDSLDFEEISDEELEEESKNCKGDALSVDWASLVAECRLVKKPVEERPAKRIWDADNIFRKIGVSRKYAGDELFESIQKKLTAEGGEGLVSDVGGIQRALNERKQTDLLSCTNKRALSARMDLAIRRQLCGLPVWGIDAGPLCHFQVA